MTLDPTTLAGKVLWLRAKDLSGPSVAAWPDQSGQGHNGASSAGGTAATTDPTLVTGATPSGGKAVKFGVNGRSAINTHKFITLPNLGLTTVGEIWVVVKGPIASTTDNTAAPGLWQFGPTTADRSLFPYNNANIYENFGRSTRWNYAPTAAQTLDQWRIYRVRAKAGAWDAWLDGYLQPQGPSVGAVAWNTTPALGRSAGGNDSFDAQFGGHIAEVLVRSQESTSDEVAWLIDYFNTEHGLAVAGGASPPSTTGVTGVLTATGPAHTATITGTAAQPEPAGVTGNLVATGPAHTATMVGVVTQPAAGSSAGRAKTVRALVIDCTGGAPAVESTQIRQSLSTNYSTSLAGTPVPIRIPLTSYALVVSEGSPGRYMQVWDLADNSLVSETSMPGDPIGLWVDPADPATVTVLCWGDWGLPAGSIEWGQSNTVAVLSGVGNPDPQVVVRGVGVDDYNNRLIGSTDPYLDTPGLVGLRYHSDSDGNFLSTDVDAIDAQTGIERNLAVGDDIDYNETVANGYFGPGRAMALATGDTAEVSLSGDYTTSNVGVRFYAIEYAAGGKVFPVWAQYVGIIPATDGVPSQIDTLHAGSHGVGIDPVQGRVLIASTMVSNDFEPQPSLADRFSLVASVIKGPALEVAHFPPPPPVRDHLTEKALPASGEGFYDLDLAADFLSKVLVGEVGPDADHVLVGAGPRLATADDDATLLSVSHVQDTASDFVQDAPGIRLAAWEPSADETLVDFDVSVRVWCDDVGYASSGKTLVEVWAYDAADPSGAGVRLIYNGQVSSNTWVTLTSTETAFYPEARAIILPALARGDLIIAATVGSAYYGDVTSKVTQITASVKTLSETDA